MRSSSSQNIIFSVRIHVLQIPAIVNYVIIWITTDFYETQHAKFN